MDFRTNLRVSQVAVAPVVDGDKLGYDLIVVDFKGNLWRLKHGHKDWEPMHAAAEIPTSGGAHKRKC